MDRQGSCAHRERFDSMANEEVFLVTVKPIAGLMHSGGNGANKCGIYRELSPGRRAAYLFWVLYSHAPDPPRFYTWAGLHARAQANDWDALVSGMRRIECAGFLRFPDACGRAFAQQEQEKREWTDFTAADLEAPA